jgi:threonyl-tRNA synthetase
VFLSRTEVAEKAFDGSSDMSPTVRVSLPDGSEREFPAGTTVLGVAEAIGPRLARDTVAGMVNGELVDLRTPINSDADLRIVTTKDPEAGDVIRHSA